MRLAVYTTYCGLNDYSTIKPYPIQNRYPHYLVSNNKNFLETISKSFGYRPIYFDVEPTADSNISAKQAKVPKILPHLFKELTCYDYLLYYDDKLVPNLFEVESVINELNQNESPMGLRKHPTAPSPNVLFDFAESMYQWRYRADWELIVNYLTEEVNSGYSLAQNEYFATGLILRNMKHKDTQALNELWYNHTQRAGAVCQITFHFARQRFNNIMVLPEKLLNHWL
jgi:hypothetical protein